MSAAGTTDRSGAVRAGEELNVAAVDTWLKAQVDGLDGQPVVTQYSGGASNWTYRLRYPSHDLVLRRPPAGTKAKSAHDMGREFKVQRALRPAFPYVPEMVAYCEDPAVLGSEFYVMRRVDGVIPRGSGLGVRTDAATTRAVCHSVLDRLVDLHQVNPAAVGLESLGKGAGYARRQVEGWTDRFAKAHTWNVPRFARVTSWLKDHAPDDVATCVIHNDYRLDNVVLDPADPTHVLAILDWEMATLGDPLMDLGNSLAYWVEAGDDVVMRSVRRQPTHLPGMLRRAEVVEYYCGRMGLKPAHWPFYEVYGLFRLAVIAQQIYYRYHHGQTRNPAFRNFWLLEHYLQWRCGQVMKRRG
jgi:aminoglycoside phosphotransferase (APT) family kinase protein